MSTEKKKNLKRLDLLYKGFEKVSKEMAGYPSTHFFNYSPLFHFMKFSLNNVGDPFFGSSYYKLNTHDIEKQVIQKFAELFHAPKECYWGYVTNGGTEGNLYGFFMARELHPDGIVFYSDQTHYSIPKNLRILRMASVKVKSDAKGEIDYQALQNALMEHKGKTPIILANIGTTMKGAVDDVVKIQEILSDLEIKKYYIHCDAAFFGMILPFLPELESQVFDFRVGIDSIAISGHKMMGTPIPCGVVLTKKEHTEQIGEKIEYIGTKDNTITGSRSGLSPLFLWYELTFAEEGKLKKLVRDCIKRAGYAVKKFNDHGIKAWRNKNSIIIIFPRPSEKTIKKWQLAVEGEIAHMITMPHLPHKVIDQIIEQVAADLKKGHHARKKLITLLP